MALAPQTAETGSMYSVHPSIAYAQSVVANMKKNTGRSLEEWIALVNDRGPAEESERAAWLKSDYKLGTNYSGWIAARSVGKAGHETDPDEYLKDAAAYVEEMYAGKRAGLRPIHDELLRVG